VTVGKWQTATQQFKYAITSFRVKELSTHLEFFNISPRTLGEKVIFDFNHSVSVSADFLNILSIKSSEEKSDDEEVYGEEAGNGEKRLADLTNLLLLVAIALVCDDKDIGIGIGNGNCGEGEGEGAGDKNVVAIGIFLLCAVTHRKDVKAHIALNFISGSVYS